MTLLDNLINFFVIKHFSILKISESVNEHLHCKTEIRARSSDERKRNHETVRSATIEGTGALWSAGKNERGDTRAYV